MPEPAAKAMDIEGWRKRIDELDLRLVELINQRAECAQRIGRLKQHSSMPIYEPDREKIIYENIARTNAGPLSNMQLRQIYERLIDVMRQVQQVDVLAEEPEPVNRTELESND